MKAKYSSDSLKESIQMFWILAISFLSIGFFLLAVLISKGDLKKIDLMYVVVFLVLGFSFLVGALSFCNGFMKIVNKEFYLFKKKKVIEE